MSSNTPTTTPSGAAKRGAARKPKLAPLPALYPPGDISMSMDIFSAIRALNAGVQAEALGRHLHALYKDPKTDFTTRQALIHACVAMDVKALESFRDARDAGGLPYAWHGSKALVQSLPASLLAKHSATHTATTAQGVAA